MELHSAESTQVRRLMVALQRHFVRTLEAIQADESSSTGPQDWGGSHNSLRRAVRAFPVELLCGIVGRQFQVPAFGRTACVGPAGQFQPVTWQRDSGEHGGGVRYQV